MSNELDGFCLRPLPLKKQVLDTMFWASGISSTSHYLSTHGFPNFSWLIVRAVLIRSSDTWDEVYFLVLFFVSTSAAFLFWFLLWFACILAFSFELCVDVASLELTFGCFDCFVRRLFPLLCLPFAVVYFFLPRFQYRNWNFMIRIAVRGLQFLLINWYII